MYKKSWDFLAPQVRVNWGGYSQIASELSLLKCSTENGSYSYYHLLSGADLPLKSQDEIHVFFDKNNGKEFVRFQNEIFQQEKRVRYYHLFQEILPRYSNSFTIRLAHRFNHLFLLFQKRIGIERNKNITFQKGTNWFSITDGFARLVVAKSEWIYETFKFTHCCDEVFLQTILVNSDYKDKCYIKEKNNSSESIMRYIDWERGSPYTFRIEDYDTIMESGMLFARKFSADIDAEIVKKIRYHVIKRENPRSDCTERGKCCRSGCQRLLEDELNELIYCDLFHLTVFAHKVLRHII